MKAYSLDLRIKMVESVRRGVSTSETTRRFGVNRSTVAHYLKRLDENNPLAAKKAPGSCPKLDGSAMRLLLTEKTSCASASVPIVLWFNYTANRCTRRCGAISLQSAKGSSY